MSLLIYLLDNLHHFAKRISFLTIFLGTQIRHLHASMVIISTLSHIHIQMVHCTFVLGLLPTRILGKANSFLIIASIIGQSYLLYSSGLFFLVFTSSLLFYFWEGWPNFNGIDWIFIYLFLAPPFFICMISSLLITFDRWMTSKNSPQFFFLCLSCLMIFSDNDNKDSVQFKC